MKKTNSKKPINFQTIEKKWQAKWEKAKIFEVKENPKKKKFYCLEMYPYPSSSGLHMGHAFNYTIGDIRVRFKRMQGFNVLYPMGYDSFGLPAENAAIKAQSHPKIFTEKAIKNFIKQQKSLGLSYDWSRVLQSHNTEYYKWNQYFFLQFFKKGLIYRKKSPANWCSKCNTVLANEQVHNGKCWRHQDTDIEIKNLEQWFIKTTAYAEELLSNINNLNWPKKIKTMQENWIGKSEGVEIIFNINGKSWPVFTTRPDTIFGVTFMVISAQHQDLMDIVNIEERESVISFVSKIKSSKQKDIDKMEKEGVFTGSYAKHPITGESIPVWVSNFVLADYGSGMVMAVPAHDQRDFEFAKKYEIPIKVVISKDGKEVYPEHLEKAYEGEGILINSGDFNSLETIESRGILINALKKLGIGKKTVQYKLRDWLVSRQRYWGTPIPIIYCKKCGIVPVPEKDLPVKLPEKIKFGRGNPLETNKNFINAKCPNCKSKARRETDTMDTFFDSSWYFLRFTDPKNKELPFNKKTTEYWMPVDFYTGGAEHACMHLIYARFFTKALRDLGLIDISEPFIRLFNQGMMHGEDGHVMSKSRGNIVDPLEITKKYSSDTLRLFLVSMSSPDKDSVWNSKGIEGSWKFLNKLFNYITKIKPTNSSKKIEHKINKSIKEITEDIESLRYNSLIIKLRSLFETIEEENQISKKDLESFIKLLSPICPHIAEELWQKLGKKSLVSLESWPQADESKIAPEIEKQEQLLEQTISDINNIIKLLKEKQNKSPNTIYLYVIPNELSIYNEDYLTRKLNLEVKIFAVNDKHKFDPENKSQKAKPSKPGIYVN